MKKNKKEKNSIKTKVISKSKSQQETTSQTSVLVSVTNVLDSLSKYKEALTITIVAIGFILTIVWEFVCEIYYKGYIDYFNINTLYYQKNNQNLLISFITIVGLCLLITLPVFFFAQWVESKNPIKRRSITFVVVTASVVATTTLVIVNSYIKAQWLTLITGLLVIITLILVMFTIVYIPIMIILIDVEKTKKDKSAETKENKKISIDLILKIVKKVIPTVLLMIVIIYLLVYIIGYVEALQCKEFSILANSKTQEINESECDYVILSETDECYYMARCKVDKIDNDGYKITIYKNQYIVKQKQEENRIATLHFNEAVVE